MGEDPIRRPKEDLVRVLAVRPEISAELDAEEAARRDAEAAYLAALSKLVDMGSLTGGRDGYDFYVCVPAGQMHATTQRIVDLEYDIRERFGIRFRTYAIATDIAV